MKRVCCPECVRRGWVAYDCTFCKGWGVVLSGTPREHLERMGVRVR